MSFNHTATPLYKLQSQHPSVVCYHYLEAVEVCRLEVIRGASTPVHDVFVLALTAQFTIPVGDAQVVIHHALTMGAVLQHSVEERLGGGKHNWMGRERERETKLEDFIPFVFFLHYPTHKRKQSSKRERTFTVAHDKHPISKSAVTPSLHFMISCLQVLFSSPAHLTQPRKENSERCFSK